MLIDVNIYYTNIGTIIGTRHTSTEVGTTAIFRPLSVAGKESPQGVQIQLSPLFGKPEFLYVPSDTVSVSPVLDEQVKTEYLRVTSPLTIVS